MYRGTLRTTVAVIFLLLSFKSNAKLLQILHMNDIHGHMDHTTHKPGVGGYARIKTAIEVEKKRATARGVPTIAMDGGDYLEGHIYYLANEGKDLYGVHGNVGFDLSVIGNHDYLMGTKGLDDLLRDTETDFTLLGANFHADKQYEYINKEVKPYWETVVNGIKVGVVGVTINDILYEWRLEGGSISSEIKAARKYAKLLKKRGNDIIIALTHIGTTKDKLLAKMVPEIDVIVGGHSHTTLHKPIWVKTKKGKMVPIVQAGKHGEWLGRLVLDVNTTNNTTKLVSYKLLPVTDVSKDQEIEQQIKKANDSLFALFGEGWLNEIVGYSKLRPKHEGGSEDHWLFFINDAMKEATDSDMAINVEALSGSNYPTTGPITRRDLYNSNPRNFEFENKFGYNVWTARIKGMWLAIVFKVVMRFNIPLYFSGVTFDWKDKGDGKYSVKNLKFDGKRLKLFKYYKVSFSEAIVRGGMAITKWVKLLLRFPDNYMVSIWRALEDKLTRMPIVDENYADDYFWGKNFVEQKHGRQNFIFDPGHAY